MLCVCLTPCVRMQSARGKNTQEGGEKRSYGLSASSARALTQYVRDALEGHGPHLSEANMTSWAVHLGRRGLSAPITESPNHDRPDARHASQGEGDAPVARGREPRARTSHRAALRRAHQPGRRRLRKQNSHVVPRPRRRCALLLPHGGGALYSAARRPLQRFAYPQTPPPVAVEFLLAS